MSLRFTLCVLAALLIISGCDEGRSFSPRPGLSGTVSLQNQSEHSGVLVRIVDLDSVAVTDSSGAFAFSDVSDGRWQVEASYPYFETDAFVIEVLDGLQRNSANSSLRQLLRFWVELPDTLVSFCKCERSFELLIDCFVENLTSGEVTVACGSTPLRDFAVAQESGEYFAEHAAPSVAGGGLNRLSGGPWKADGGYDFCSTYGMLLPGMLDMPGSVKIKARETLKFEIDAWAATECFEDGRYQIYWALVDCSNHWEHYVYDAPELNGTLLRKPELLEYATVRLIESSH